MALILSGRVIVYTNQVPYETDVLRTNLYQLTDVCNLAETVLGVGIGNPVLARGLPCAPISPPGMAVTVGPGVFYSFQFLDATAYGVLPADTNPNHMQYKQGINFDPQTFNTPAPTTAPGDSQIYLIQGEFQTQDVNNVSRPYFNSANPTQPIFNSNFDTRQDLVFLSVKAGSPAPSPSPPAPDAGFTALYYVTVAYGQTSVVSGNISVVPGAPFITESLTQKISSSSGDMRYVQYSQYQNQSPIYGNDTGSVNAYALTISPAPLSLTIGMKVSFKAANTNTSASTFNLNALGAGNIQTSDGNAIVSGYIVSGSTYELTYLGSNLWQLMNPTVPQSISAGFVMDFAGTSAPLGWLALTSANTDPTQNVSRTTYAALFAAIGTTWGVGDGSTTFGLPPGARVVNMGAGGTGTSIISNTVGSKGGEEAHTQSILEMPNHNHSGSYITLGLDQKNASGANGLIQPNQPGYSNANETVTVAPQGGGNAFNIIQSAIITLRCIKY
jgi:microcystin-dependent protein